jgi:DNA polymerase-4
MAPSTSSASDRPGAPARWARAILHVDMDAFYVAVEVRRDPALAGKPVVVGGSGPRGVVASASYEARAFGVRSAMPGVQARRLCPQAIFLPGDYAAYSEASAALMALFARFTPLVEPLSLDEAFLDVTGAQRRLGPPGAIGAAVRAAVEAEQDLRCSVGVAPNKFMAKLASEAAKPRATPEGARDGVEVLVVEPGRELAFLHPLPLRALWGVGPATLGRLARLGIETVGDLAALPVEAVTAAVGDAVGRHLHELANGRDERPVEVDRAAKSIGHEETFGTDRHDRGELEGELVRLADSVAARLRGSGLAGRTVTLKLRYGSFRTLTRSRSVPTPLDGGADIAREARRLLAGLDVSEGVRLIGVSVSGLARPETRQLHLDLDRPAGVQAGRPGGARAGAWVEANEAVDAIRSRFGAASIGPGALATRDGLRLLRRGAQQWGPDGDPARPHGDPAETDGDR